MQKNLLSISSKYDMSVQFTDAAYAEAAQSLFLGLFRPLKIWNDKDEASRKYNEILIPLQQRFKESDRSHFPWLKSKRFKTKTFPSDLCIKERSRCFEKQDIILDGNGKKLGSNSPNVSLPSSIYIFSSFIFFILYFLYTFLHQIFSSFIIFFIIDFLYKTFATQSNLTR